MPPLPRSPRIRKVPKGTDGLSRILTSSDIPIRVLPPTAAQVRLDYHKAVLESMGISDLGTLGKLSLSGNVIPQPGITRPPLPPAAGQPETGGDIFGSTTLFQGAFGLTGTGPRPNAGRGLSLERIGGSARFLKSQPFPIAPAPLNPSLAGTAVAILAPPAPTIPREIPQLPDAPPLLGRPPAPRFYAMLALPIHTAYWVATWIDLPDNTNVILKSPNQFLVLITEKLTVGQNVTFTWERPLPALPSKPGKPDRPGAGSAASTTIDKPPATQSGTAGVQGGVGPNGFTGPEIEVWMLELSGRPVFDLAGQNGFQGGEGGDGGDGSNGTPGKPDAVDGWGFCASGPGNGGDGGAGGAAGDGGPGGSAGDGGKLSIFAPQPVLNALTANVQMAVGGGTGGPGGMPGVPGSGGAGGPRGDNSHGCAPAAGQTRTAGAAGAQGAAGHQGPSGHPGQNGTLSLNVIAQDDFRRELEKPAIVSLSQQFARTGETISASGLRFTHSDVVRLNGTPCQTTVVSDTLLAFVVPETTGGQKRVEVTQSDGTLSNPISLYVLPTLSPRDPAERLQPGSRLTVTGTGFAPGARVRINDQDMPDTQFVDAKTLSFTVVRPAAVVRNPSGEHVSLKVVLGDGTPSNSVSAVLDTFRILVCGDSIAWGQGLDDAQKFSAQVESLVAARRGNIGVYRDVFAHSGAVIGMGNTTVMPALNGEVPTSFPTVVQQVAGFNDLPENVDLILVDGGINDIDVRAILNPTTSTQSLTDLVEQHCHLDMRALLTTMVAKFPGARIIVTGYYAILSDQSNPLLVVAFITAAGLVLAGPGGAVVTGTLSAAALHAIFTNCATLATQSTLKLQQAVDEVNATLGGAPRVSLAVPAIGPANAALAPDPFVFGIHADLSPEDAQSVAGNRSNQCVLAGPGRTDVETCKRASVGHPNVKGALAYFDAITAVL